MSLILLLVTVTVLVVGTILEHSVPSDHPSRPSSITFVTAAWASSSGWNHPYRTTTPTQSSSSTLPTAFHRYPPKDCRDHHFRIYHHHHHHFDVLCSGWDRNYGGCNDLPSYHADCHHHYFPLCNTSENSGQWLSQLDQSNHLFHSPFRLVIGNRYRAWIFPRNGISHFSNRPI